MIEPEELFYQIIEDLPNAIKGKMFGAISIKSSNGKTAAFFWKGNMVFKLDDKSQEEALKLDSVKIGSHLYAPDKQMKGWVSIPGKHSDLWADFTKKAINFVGELKN